jgi:hypothetical protein
MMALMLMKTALTAPAAVVAKVVSTKQWCLQSVLTGMLNTLLYITATCSAAVCDIVVDYGIICLTLLKQIHHDLVRILDVLPADE